MTIIKEYCERNDTVVLRRDDYAHSAADIYDLLEEAERDFPFEDDDGILNAKIVVYGGERYKRTYGIEFLNPLVVKPPVKLYRRIKNLEQRL